ncbi:hypothetical protein EVAR_53902_1 [Eumeta japonica]|uniref:Reverse transcriptase domain-containing protein n=1 Tax=Eumeta variegata TaxID=151549 RepID=A0A4C1YDP8_EUMVA|nr:hypothetical protein EVAR_53902_1 [Eumeta japonica]
MHEKVDVIVPLRSMSRSASEARVVGSVRFVLHLSPSLDQPSTKDTRELFSSNVYKVNGTGIESETEIDNKIVQDKRRRNALRVQAGDATGEKLALYVSLVNQKQIVSYFTEIIYITQLERHSGLHSVGASNVDANCKPSPISFTFLETGVRRIHGLRAACDSRGRTANDRYKSGAAGATMRSAMSCIDLSKLYLAHCIKSLRCSVGKVIVCVASAVPDKCSRPRNKHATSSPAVTIYISPRHHLSERLSTKNININDEYIPHLRYADNTFIMMESMNNLAIIFRDLGRLSQDLELKISMDQRRLCRMSLLYPLQ